MGILFLLFFALFFLSFHIFLHLALRLFILAEYLLIWDDTERLRYCPKGILYTLFCE